MAGRESEEVFIPQDVVDAVLLLVNEHTWDGQRELVETRPRQLLGEYADLVLLVLLDQHADQPDVLDVLRRTRELLADCRTLGVADAFAHRTRPDPAVELTDDVLDRLAALTDPGDALLFLGRRPGLRRLLLEAVQALVAAGSPTAKRAVLRREERLLVTHAAEEVMRTVSGEAAWNYQAHADLVAVAREHGVDAAIEWAFGAPADEPPDGRSPEVEAILQELAYAEQYMTVERRLELCRRGLELVDPQDRLAAFFHSDLGHYLVQNAGLDRADDIEEAIGHLDTALEVYQREDLPGGAAIVRHRLAVAYQERVRGRRHDNLEHAVRLAEEAVRGGESVDPLNRVIGHVTAANAYIERYAGARAENLRLAHSHVRRAWELVDDTMSPLVRATLHQQLGGIADRGGPDEDGDRGIGHLRTACELVDPAEDPDNRVRIELQLASALLDRWSAGTAEEALEVLHAALSRTDARRRPEAWARAHEHLAKAYLRRVVGDPATNVEHALAHAEQALRVFGPDAFPDQWASALTSLGDAMRLRIGGNPLVNARTAVACYADVAAFYAEVGDDPGRLSALEKIAATHLNHPPEPGADHLREAVAIYQQVLAELGDDDPDHRMQVRTNLFSARARLVQHGDHDPALVAEVLEQGREVLAWYTGTGEADGLIAGHLALAWLRWSLGTPEDLRAARDHLEQAAAHATDDERLHVYESSGLLARVHDDLGDHERAVATRLQSIVEGERLLAAAATEASRHEILPTLGRAYDHAAYDALVAGDRDRALELVEQGRSRILLGSLAVDGDPEELPRERRSRFLRARDRVRELEVALNSPPAPGRPTNAQLGRMLLVARAELAESLVARDDEPLLSLVPPGEVVVVPLVTPAGSAFFVLPSGLSSVGQEHVLFLDDVTTVELTDVEIMWMGAMVGLEVRSGSLDEQAPRLDQAIAWLRDHVGDPLRARLRALGVPDGSRVHVEASPLSVQLPVHTVLLDTHVVSFTPNLRVLHRLVRRSAEPARQGDTCLVLADAYGDLPYAAAEARALSALLPGPPPHLGQDATADALFDGVHGVSYVHIACHAGTNYMQANYSAVWLADRPVTAGELAGLDLAGVRLVTLSACQSGVTDGLKSTGEYTGIAASLLRTGVPAVVATLWSVNDHAAYVLMTRFYDEMVHGGLVPATALRSAQLWLREATVSDLLAHQPADPTAMASARRWRMVGLGEEDKPFAHPYFWAGFTLVGT